MKTRYLLAGLIEMAMIPVMATTNYYLNGSEFGGAIGESKHDEELHASALFAEHSGGYQTLSGKKVPAMSAKGGKSVLIWKFIRRPDDERIYRVDVKMRFYVEPAAYSAENGAPELAVGFDDYRGEKRGPNYFISDDKAAGIIAVGERRAGIQEFANHDFLPVPADRKEFYLILSAPTTGSSGHYGRVESLSVQFTPHEPPTGEEADSPYWTASPGAALNVIDFGADPTGKDDSAPAIQMALDRGGDIVIPSGVYRLESTLTIRKSNTTLRGEGNAVLARIRLEGKDPETNNYTYITNSAFPGVRLLHNIRIANLRLLTPDWDRPQLNNYTKGISLFGVKNSTIENCEVRLPAHDGISLWCTENSTVRNCMTFGGRHGITVGGNFRGRGSFHTQIVNNRISRSWDTGIVVGILTNHTLVVGNQVRDIGCHGIDIFNCRNVTVTGNLVHNWTAPGVPAPYLRTFHQAVGIFIHTDWGIIRDIPTENITVSGNTLICDYPFVLPPAQQPGNQKEKAETYRSPICLEVTGDFVRNVTISGNTMTGGAKGIYLTALKPKDMNTERPLDGTPQNISVTGNTVSGQKYSALECIGTGTPMRGIITGNRFADYPGNRCSAGNSGLTENNNMK